MLRYSMDEMEAADAIEKAVEKVLRTVIVPPDIYRRLPKGRHGGNGRRGGCRARKSEKNHRRNSFRRTVQFYILDCGKDLVY